MPPVGGGDPLSIPLEFKIFNEAQTARVETFQVSIPFPEGGYPASQLSSLIVSGFQTAWIPLQYWADGTLKVAQAQFTDTLSAGQRKTYSIARNIPAASGSFVRNNWVNQMISTLEVGAEVRDTFNVPYRAFASGSGTVVQTSPFIQIRRFRGYHTASTSNPGIGRDFLTSTFYVTEYRDMPFVMVDWIVGNDYLGADTIPPGNTDPNLRPLGPVDVASATFLVKGATQAIPYRATQEGISSGVSDGSGYTGFEVMRNTFISDAQTRRYRFLLRFVPGSPSANEILQWQNTANAMVAKPAYGLATQPTWMTTRAAGLLGGPIPGPANAEALATNDLAAFNAINFGTWGSHGDTLVSGTTGTPRNTPLSESMAHAIQGNYPPLIQKLEQLAWIQAARTYHLWGLVVGDDQQIQLNGLPHWISAEHLGRDALAAPNDPYPQYRTLANQGPIENGWNAFDEEHFTVDAIFDYWTLTGDPWAKEELRVLGQQLKGLLRRFGYYAAQKSARGEGWCMQAWVQIFLATQDTNIRDYAIHRAVNIVDVYRKKDHPSRAIATTANYLASQYPFDHEFLMPWQHAAIAFGYLGAWKAWGHPKLMEIAEDVTLTVQYSWLTNVSHPSWGLITNGLRYYVPYSHNNVVVPADYWDNIWIHVGDSPLGGAHTFLISALFQIAALTSNQEVRDRAVYYGSHLRGPVSTLDRRNKWNFTIPVQYTQP